MITSPAPTPRRNQSAATSFDALAAEYDALWSGSFIGRLQRQQVWRELDTIYKPGDRVLELGCGTGIDAAHLAGNGIQVHATDISLQMLNTARERIQKAGLSHRVTCELRSVECLPDICESEPFDGALSNFGVLNCVQDLDSAAFSLARLVRPGGKLVICWIGRFCFWETIWHLLHARPGKAFRRLCTRADGLLAELKHGFQVRVFYPSVSNLAAAFKSDFSLVSFRSVAVLIPPSYMEQWAKSRRGFFERIANLDHLLGQCPLLRGIGDHRLAVFIRNASGPGR